MVGGTPSPQHSQVGCPWADKVPKEATVAPQVGTRAKGVEAGVGPEGRTGFHS